MTFSRIGIATSACAAVIALAAMGCKSAGQYAAGASPHPGTEVRNASKHGSYGLSEASKRIVQTLSKPMHADVYVTRGVPTLEAFVSGLDKLLTRYEDAARGKFSYKLIEAKTDEELEAAKSAGLKAGPFAERNASDKTMPVANEGYMGIHFRYGSENDAIPRLTPDQTDGLEYWVSQKIRDIRAQEEGTEYRLGILVGKGGIELSEPLVAGEKAPSMRTILKRALPHFVMVDIDLEGGTKEIDRSLLGLIVPQPGCDFTDKELRRIDQFVMRGKALAVFSSAAKLEATDVSMTATLDLHNLDKLLDGYGIEVASDALFDWEETVFLGVPTEGGGLATLPLVGVSQVQHQPELSKGKQTLDSGFSIFFRIPKLLVPFASSVAIHPERQPRAKLQIVARTSPRTSARNGGLISLRPNRHVDVQPPYEQHGIAAVATGVLARGMGANGTDGIDVPNLSTTDARVFVLASSLFLANPYAEGDEVLQAISQPYAQKTLLGNILTFKNTLDWIVDGELATLSTKPLSQSIGP